MTIIIIVIIIIGTGNMEQGWAAHLPKHNSVAKQAKLNLDARKNVCPITREK
jgi:hypothetical protein